MSTVTVERPEKEGAVQSVNDIQSRLLQMFRSQELASIKQTLSSCLSEIRENTAGDTAECERFLFLYLQNISKEGLRIGVPVERFESYVPAVSFLLQSDIAGCLDAAVSLTEQIMKHVGIHRTTESNHLLNMAKDYIRDHLANVDLNLEAVSDHVGLSRVYFCKLFHQMEGVSFSTYLRNERISMAKHLLLETNMRVFEVSNAVGFSHAKYFGKVFKAVVGMTPVEFQNEHIHKS